MQLESVLRERSCLNPRFPSPLSGARGFWGLVTQGSPLTRGCAASQGVALGFIPSSASRTVGVDRQPAGGTRNVRKAEGDSAFAVSQGDPWGARARGVSHGERRQRPPTRC